MQTSESNYLGEEQLLTNPVAAPCSGIINAYEKCPINYSCDIILMLAIRFLIPL